MELTERKKKILQAVISDYIRTAEPVGSKTLSTMYGLEFSPATIRNELADLEEMGYLTHPHTSAGRIPSDMGYRWYVNNMMEWKEPTTAAKNVIEDNLYDEADELDKTIERAAEILSKITNLTSFAITPKKNEETIKYINLLPVDAYTVVLMIVSESGKVSNKAVKLQIPVSEERLELIAKNLTYNYKGKTISQALTNNIISNLEDDFIAMSGLADNLMPSFMKTLEDMLDVHLYMNGLSNIFDIPEYSDIESAKKFVELISDKDSLTRKLMEREDGIKISIGSENEEKDLKNCSLITASYSVDGRPVGKIGVIGPTRMKYSEIISLMGYLTHNINELLREDIERDE